MGDDVIIGYDGKPRCAWAGAGDTSLGRYHDEVWGKRTYDESALFEALTLGVFEAGLSWSIVFGKRDAFGMAFHGFEIAQVAAMTERDVDRLVQDPSIIRNRAKIQATVENARAMRSASPTLAALTRSYESTRKRAPRSLADLPTLDAARGRVRQAVEVTGIPIRGAHQRVRVHAERRRRQRPHPRLLPSHRLQPRSDQGPTSRLTGDRHLPNELRRLATWVPRAFYESECGPGFGRRLGPQIFSRRRSVRQLRSPPVERDDPQREFERASIERLSELGNSYEILA